MSHQRATLVKTDRYRYMGAAGLNEIESVSGLLALRCAKMITGNASLARLEKWNGTRWVALTQDQMVLGPDGKANLLGAYGSASARTARKAMKCTEDTPA